MGSRYNLKLIILHVIDLLVIADPIMGSCYNMNLIILTFYWWPYAWVLAFAGWPHVGVLAFVGPMSGSYCGYLWETKLSCNDVFGTRGSQKFPPHKGRHFSYITYFIYFIIHIFHISYISIFSPLHGTVKFFRRPCTVKIHIE